MKIEMKCKKKKKKQLCDTAKAQITGKFIALNIYIKKIGKSQLT